MRKMKEKKDRGIERTILMDEKRARSRERGERP